MTRRVASLACSALVSVIASGCMLPATAPTTAAPLPEPARVEVPAPAAVGLPVVVAPRAMRRAKVACVLPRDVEPRPSGRVRNARLVPTPRRAWFQPDCP
jgi:hypothetical protein